MRLRCDRDLHGSTARAQISGSSANPTCKAFDVWAYPLGVGGRVSPRLMTRSPSTGRQDQPTSSFISATSSVSGVTPSPCTAPLLVTSCALVSDYLENSIFMPSGVPEGMITFPIHSSSEHSWTFGSRPHEISFHSIAYRHVSGIVGVFQGILSPDAYAIPPTTLLVSLLLEGWQAPLAG
jgi:hypothetical protein